MSSTYVCPTFHQSKHAQFRESNGKLWHSALQVANSLCGGDLNWAYDVDQFSRVLWTNTAEPILEEPIASRDWKRPLSEMTKFTDRVLEPVISGHYKDHCSGVTSGSDIHKAQCHGPPDKTLPDLGYSECCWPKILWVSAFAMWVDVRSVCKILYLCERKDVSRVL